MTKILILLLTAIAGRLTNSLGPLLNAQPGEPVKPKIAFTFDDGSIDDFGQYKLETWNQRLLNHLKKNNLKAILFSACTNKSSPRGKYILNSWNDAGHLIANHTFSHVNFNRKQVSLDDFKLELIKNDSLIIRPLHLLLSISLSQGRRLQRKSGGVQSLTKAEKV